MRKVQYVVMVAVLAVGLAACSSSETPPEEPATTGSGEEVIQPGANEEVPSEAAATVNAIDFAFEPNEIEIAKGTDITFTNDGEVAHTLTLTSTPLGVEAQPGESVNLISGDLDAGTYDFMCMFHNQMTGTITIT